MHARTHGEKKGLIPATQEELIGQTATYQLLASIQAASIPSSGSQGFNQEQPIPTGLGIQNTGLGINLPIIPKVTPFQIPLNADPSKRPLELIRNKADQEDSENLAPGTEIVMTKPIRLIRAEQPMTFDVVSLSRSVAEEETTRIQIDWGQLETGDDALENERDGGEDEEYDE